MLKTLVSAQSVFQSGDKDGDDEPDYAQSLAELGKYKLIAPALAKGLRKGMSNEQAERRAIDRGIFTERTVLGKASSGVLSIPDLEANYRGMLFLWEMCEGDAPYLQRGEREPVGFEVVGKAPQGIRPLFEGCVPPIRPRRRRGIQSALFKSG